MWCAYYKANMWKFIGVLCIFLLIENSVVAEVITFEPCSNNACDLHEVRVTPCKEQRNGKNAPCRIRIGANITIEFDYTPSFNANHLLSQAYSAYLNLAMPGMDTEACKHTTCPAKSGEKNLYRNALYMAPFFPRLPYTVKWRLWDADNDVNGCCFTFKIKLV